MTRHVLTFVNRLSSILATNSLTFLFIFRVPFAKIPALTGYNLLGTGLGAWILSASARVYGKRHAYILGILFVFAGSIWGAKADSYNSLLGARILQGFGIAPFEMLVPTSIADMYDYLWFAYLVFIFCSLGTSFISVVAELRLQACASLVLHSLLQ